MNESSCQGFQGKNFGIQKQRRVSMTNVIPLKNKRKREVKSTEIRKTETTRVMNIGLTKEIKNKNKQKSLDNLKKST